MKHRKTLKILALAAALVLIVGLAWFANGLLGNPVSRMLARRGAEAYMAETYADTDYQIDEVGYDFKDGRYYAKISSPSSPDSFFRLSITATGKVRWDGYESSVEGRWNTFLRVDGEYRELVKRVLESPSFPYESDICYGTLAISQREAIEDPDATEIPPYSLVCEDLELDRVYDVSELGRLCGEITIYVMTDDLSFDNAARLLTEIRTRLDDAGVGFRAVHFNLREPKPEGQPWSEKEVHGELLYEDLEEAGLVQRVEAAHAALDAAYKAEDLKKQTP